MKKYSNRSSVTLLAAGLCLFSSIAMAQSKGTLSSAVPDGISYAWVFPQNSPSYLGEAALVVENPNGSKNISSGVWFVEADGYRITASNPEKYNEPIRVAHADLDMDGWQDVLVAFRNRSAARFFIGREDLDPLIYEQPLPSGPAWNIGIGDINSDGLNDLAVLDSSQITILLQDKELSAGKASFSLLVRLATLYPTRANPLASDRFLFGDYNGDFRTDFIVNGWLFLNLAPGQFTARELPYRGDAQTISRLDQVMDADGDGKPELFYVESTGAGVKSYKLVSADYNPTEIFKAGFNAITTSSRIDRVFIDDFNKDGFPDLEVHTTDNTLYLIAGTKAGIRNVLPDSLNDTWSRGTLQGLLDLGQDKLLDWMYLDSVSDSLFIRYPQGGFLDRTVEAGLDRKMAGLAVAVADYDNDGLQDFFAITGGVANALYQGQSGGKFLDVASAAGISSYNDGISCAWGDYDNDGFADLFVAGIFLPDKLFHNNGDGTFSDSSKALRLDRKGQQRATSACWGDVNRDGFLDLLIGNYDGVNWLLINRSGRYFEEHGADYGLAAKEYTESSVLIDVNRDGWLDIVTLNKEGPTRLLLGGGDGKFTDRTSASGLNPSTAYKLFGQTQNWGDFNGDGYPDLYITRAEDVDMLFLNTGLKGGDRFELKFSDNLNGKYGRIASAIADFNSDGLPDLLIARTSVFGDFYNIPDDLLFFGSAQGWPVISTSLSQTQSRTSSAETFISGLAMNLDSSLPVAEDFDQDGDLDILYVNYLPDNSSDLFHGSARPLRYIQQQNTFSNTVTIVLNRTDRKNVVGTQVLLAYGGKIWWQTVSGGYGRIQTGRRPFYSLGTAPYADSLVVYWPEGDRQSMPGPIYAGQVVITVDHAGPLLTLTDKPGGSDMVIASPTTFSGTLKVSDPSPLGWLKTIIRHPVSGVEDTLSLDATVSGSYQVKVPSPAPGDSLYYYFEAADAYGNQSRLPASKGSYFKLQALPGVFLGDLNNDLRINILDLVRLLQIMGASGPPPTQNELKAGDMNRDGRIDQLDLSLLISKIGTGY
ncbi:MAG: hypothetical protein A2Z86_11730 [Candidatus Glassbacteria bacterium GWA2_58_10]|uniref:Dockerin domain-containing protein n=1 Tax=Candidatus Glassbacteria bacterium GWA2_58_10 TaxID=1817865 RepID=A0A1F5YDA1_9BACT|nr:MAG: hypothetical protein A2Z86_11730 [Candidatus Glassbacteria bacterium GWA2_58_10]